MLGRRALALLIAVALAVWSASAAAQVVRPDLWTTNGEVRSLARIGNTLYFAGYFGLIGPSPGGFVPLDRRTGAPRRPFPRVAGIVCVAIPDGHGGWFIGGDFSAVEGEPRVNLAHVLDDGELAEWNPAAEIPDAPYRPFDPFRPGTVSALALHGRTLYVGGGFTRIGGREQAHLAAVDARTGSVLPFTRAPDGVVTALVIRRNTLYVGGGFGHIAGAERHAIAALTLPVGRPTAWDPSADGLVRAIAFHDRTVVVGGEFDHVGGAARNSIAALDMEGGGATAWDAGLLPIRQYLPHGNRIWPFVSGLAARGSTVYVAGDFETIGGRDQRAFAALDLEDGAATGFDARAGAGSRGSSLALDDHVLFVGGYFYSFGDSVRPNIAALDARTGAATPWNPRADGVVRAIASEGRTVFAGGGFRLVHDWEERYALAAIDVDTGLPRDWAPKLDGYVSDMVTIGNTLYLCGDFTHVDGQPRGHLAEFDGATGALTGWDPWDQQVPPGGIGTFATFPINRMARIGSTLYAGGEFEQIDGVARRDLAAIDAGSGAILDWNAQLFPAAGGSISAIAARGETVYVAGTFDFLGGMLRRELAALDGTTGLATPWNPVGMGSPAQWDLVDVFTIAPTGDGTYVGGWFLSAAGAPRMSLAAFDAAGRLLPLDAHIDASGSWIVGWQPAVRALLPVGRQLIVGGRFDQIGGRELRDLAVLDPRTGLAGDWNPDPVADFPTYRTGVQALALAGDTLYVGGSFSRFGGYPAGGLAVVLMPQARARRAELLASTVAPASLALEHPLPNPSRTEAELGFTLPAASVATLEVFDVEGRRILAPLDRASLSAGPHAVRVSTRGWAPGVYCLRLAAAGYSTTRKLIVVR